MKYKKLFIILLLLALIIVFLIVFKKNLLKIIYPKTYNEVVAIYHDKYNIDENFIFALIKAETYGGYGKRCCIEKQY